MEEEVKQAQEFLTAWCWLCKEETKFVTHADLPEKMICTECGFTCQTKKG